jgi:hypothetical protein
MKNKKKAQNEKILIGFKKVLLDNKANLTDKIEKAVKKSIKKIVKNAFKKNSKIKNEKPEAPVPNPVKRKKVAKIK